MMLTTAGTTRLHKSAVVNWTIALLTILGLGAVAGGWAMTFAVGEGSIALPDEYLAEIPLIDSWVLPGLVLFFGFGIGSLVTAYGMFRRPRWHVMEWVERTTGHHWSWAATIAIGIGHVIWIGLELIYIPFSWLMPTFGTVGLLLALLPFTKGVREYLKT